MIPCKHREQHDERIVCHHPRVIANGSLPLTICETCELAEAPPSTWNRGATFARAMLRWAFRDHFRLAERAEVRRRRRICASCPHNDDGWCRDCGCNIKAKTAVPSQHCPIGGWGEPQTVALQEPPPATQPAPGCGQCGKSTPVNNTNLAVGVTTAPRAPITLRDCLASMRDAGLPPTHVFADDGLVVDEDTRSLSASVIARGHRLGAWRNFVQSVRDLLQIHPNAGRILVVQDDTIFCRNVGALLEQTAIPRNAGAVLLGTPRAYGANGDGLVQLTRTQSSDLQAAWALLFTRDSAERLVSHELAKTWQGWANRRIESLEERKGIDTFVGRVMNRLRRPCYAFVPSLCDHVGHSTLGHGPPRGKRSAAEFPGRDADAMEIFAAAKTECRANPPDVAVVLPCHNYGRFLGEALDSVLAQTHRPSEILVVDDASSDETPDVARRYADRGVRYLRIDARNVHHARRAGLNATMAPALCFLDADDVLPPEYLKAAALLRRPVGIVYSEFAKFGMKDFEQTFPEFDADLLQRRNYIHAGSIVLREAIEESGAFDFDIEPATQNDWFLWRRIVNAGWDATKQTAKYRYRRHPASMQVGRRSKPVDYFDNAGLIHETLTLFIPLSGRMKTLGPLLSFLDAQTWSHDRVELILFDTSRNRVFKKRLKDWVAACDYPGVRVVEQRVGRDALADGNRTNRRILGETRRAVARIYQQMQGLIRERNEYVWVLEDDVIPPADVAVELMHGFHADVMSVAAPYRSRWQDRYVVHDQNGSYFTRPGSGWQTVGGNGLGCTIVRRSVLQYVDFPLTTDCDVELYRQTRGRFKAKVNWDLESDHLVNRGNSV